MASEHEPITEMEGIKLRKHCDKTIICSKCKYFHRNCEDENNHTPNQPEWDWRTVRLWDK